MSSCIRTGCSVAFEDSLEYMYWGDAYQFEDKVIFKVKAPRYSPGALADFIIRGNCLEINQVLVTNKVRVLVRNEDIITMWSEFYPNLLNEFIVEL